ncbi:hypothetical protein [Clostridium sp. B9]|uniref:hypothetical protein n=1 Tax=Clostridium sp. B9 TaxID=3423224 RepID=UPI003D2ECB77
MLFSLVFIISLFMPIKFKYVLNNNDFNEAKLCFAGVNTEGKPIVENLDIDEENINALFDRLEEIKVTSSLKNIESINSYTFYIPSEEKFISISDEYIDLNGSTLRVIDEIEYSNIIKSFLDKLE